MSLKICIIGGGINGLCCAWVLSKRGHVVSLYEQDKLVSKTSQASSKLLHGGLRYLEQGEFRLVKEALNERDAWLKRAPELTNKIRLVLPIYKKSRRSRWLVKVGLFLYENLAGTSALPKSKWLTREALLQEDPGLKKAGLIGGYAFYDGQMDDYLLGNWVADQARDKGAKLYENINIDKVDRQGAVYFNGGVEQFDFVVNTCGPWAIELLRRSNIQSKYQLDVVRGSHLVLNKKCRQGYLFEVPGERRIFFVLPWKGLSLLGTTDEKQLLTDPIECSDKEQKYLLSAYNYYHEEEITSEDVMEVFSGIRPLLASTKSADRITRDYVFDKTGKLITVLGGKWTTAMALADKVAVHIK